MTIKYRFSDQTSTRGETVRHPNQYVLPPSKFNEDTEYTRSFQGISSGCPRNPIRHTGNLRVDNGDVEKVTTMKNDYVKYDNTLPISKAQPPADNHDRWNTGCVGSTSYKQEYGTKDIPIKHVIPKKKYNPSEKPFGGLSTYRNTYKPYPIHKKVSSYKPTDTYRTPTSPFMDKTTTKETYQPWDVQPRSKPAWGERQLHTTDGPFDHRTNYRETYIRQPAGKREKPASTRADTTIEMTHGPKVFHKNTEYTDRYHQHQGAEKAIPKPHPMQTYVPGGPMDCKTTYNNDYIKKAAAKVAPMNPAPQNSSGGAVWGREANYDTTYNDTYKGNQTKCPASGLVPTSGASKLLKQTTSTLEHTQQQAGHYYFTPRGQKTTEALRPSPTTPRNETSKAVVKNSPQGVGMSKIPAPLFSPDGRLNSPGVKVATPTRNLSFDCPPFEKSISGYHRQTSTPVPAKNSRDDYRDFFAEEVGYCREGTNYYELNSTMNTTLNDEVPCTCNTSYNNNSWMENNNYILNKNLMDSGYDSLDGISDIVDFEKIFEVVSVMPSKEETWSLST